MEFLFLASSPNLHFVEIKQEDFPRDPSEMIKLENDQCSSKLKSIKNISIDKSYLVHSESLLEVEFLLVINLKLAFENYLKKYKE